MKRQTRSKKASKRALYEYRKNKKALYQLEQSIMYGSGRYKDQRYRHGGISDPTAMIVAMLSDDPLIRDLKRSCKPVDLLIRWAKTQPEKEKYLQILELVYFNEKTVFIANAAEILGLDVAVARALHGNLLEKISDFLPE